MDRSSTAIISRARKTRTWEDWLHGVRYTSSFQKRNDHFFKSLYPTILENVYILVNHLVYFHVNNFMIITEKIILNLFGVLMGLGWFAPKLLPPEIISTLHSINQLIVLNLHKYKSTTTHTLIILFLMNKLSFFLKRSRVPNLMHQLKEKIFMNIKFICAHSRRRICYIHVF